MDKKIAKVNFFGQYLASARSVDETLDMAMSISQDVLGYDHAIIRLLEGDELQAVKWIGFPMEAADMVIQTGEGICGAVARDGKAILVEETLQDSRFLEGVENCRSELCVPMLYNRKTIGIFNVESDNPSFFTKQDRHILETFAAQIATAMEMARLREKLGQAEKLSVVGTFASSILHDIRNDIHRLNISSDMLGNPDIDRKRLNDISRYVRESANSIYGLIEDVFEFVKTGDSRLTKKQCPMAPILKTVTDQLLLLAPANVEIKLVNNGPQTLEVDQTKFRRVLMNLGKNGMEAMPDGGTLEIISRGMNGAAVVEVTDNGVGIETARLKRIWEPLYTFGKQGGTGLGMAIVKKIVEDHGWEISVSSKIGKGTTFTITTGNPPDL